MSAAGFEVFRCVPLGTRLRREACADRHRRAIGGAGRSFKGEAPLSGAATCATCELGICHAAGERPDRWIDGELVEVSRLRLPARPDTVNAGADAPSEEPPRPTYGGSPPPPAPAVEEAPRGAHGEEGERVAKPKRIECGHRGEGCHGSFERTHGRQLFCPPCGEARRVERSRARQRERRAAAKAAKADREELDELEERGRPSGSLLEALDKAKASFEAKGARLPLLEALEAHGEDPPAPVQRRDVAAARRRLLVVELFGFELLAVRLGGDR